jgi:hypothetical protein
LAYSFSAPIAVMVVLDAAAAEPVVLLLDGQRAEPLPAPRQQRDLSPHLPRACGRVVAVDGTEILDWGKQVAAEAGYTFTGYAVALSGLCPAHAG